MVTILPLLYYCPGLVVNMDRGFECTFVEKPPKAIQSECPVCLLVLWEPYQVTCCGYSFCRVCTEQIKLKSSPCPCCKAQKLDYYPNKGLQRTLYEFQVNCIHQKQGCQWVGELGQLESHLNSKPTGSKQFQGCQYTRIKCLYCPLLRERSNIQAYQGEQCPRRPFSCEYCKNFTSSYEDVTTNHWPICGYYPVPCPNKCGEILQRQDLENHTATLCSLTTVDCDFNQVGCMVELSCKDIQAHLTECVNPHVLLLMISHKKLEEENKQLKHQMERLKQTMKLQLKTKSVEIVMTNYNRHLLDDTVWVSPPFFTHPCGYKVCLKVYANGKEEGKGTYVSVYLHIMQGEYDEELMWPFQATLEITVFPVKSDVFGFQTDQTKTMLNCIQEKLRLGLVRSDMGFMILCCTAMHTVILTIIVFIITYLRYQWHYLNCTLHYKCTCMFVTLY